tara:strand:- start:1272 stop:2573 length:1302 start_codon:yes stop_codon:yes gene_type:complete
MKIRTPIFFIFISSIIFGYIIFKSEGIWQGTRREYYFVYYIISFGFIIFSLITFFLSSEINKILLITFLSSIFAIYCFEGYINLKKLYFSKNYIEKKSEIYFKKTGKLYDTRTKTEIYLDLKKEKNNTSILMYPRESLEEKNNLVYLSGFKNSLTISCNENGYYAVDKSDRYGFNNEDSLWDLDKIDVLVIGDSYAYGECVNRKDNFANQISNITGLNIINLGYGGNGPLLELATLKEYIPENFSKIIWFFTESNDLTDLSKELENDILYKYIENDKFSQNLKFKIIEKEKYLNNKLSNALNKSLSENKKFKFINFIKILNVRNLLIHNKFEPPLKEFEEIINQVLRLVNNEDLYFVYIPANERYLEKKMNNFFYKEIIEIIKNKKINLINLKEDYFDNLTNVENFYPFGKQGHFSEYGYYEVSKFISEKIKD